jgi:hypothetical protein
MTTATPSADLAKLREAILYVALCSENDPRFGKTKLFKILFYADFAMHRRYGRPITGIPYLRLPHGPVPDVRDLLEEMERQGDLTTVRRNHFGYEQFRPVARRPADVRVFSAEELDMLAQTISDLAPASARDVSDLSHEFIGWRVAREHEAIPYDTVFLETGPATEEEEAFAAELVAAGR